MNHKIPIITLSVITLLGNLLYAYLESMDREAKFSPKYWMLVSRVMMGVGAGKNND